MPAQWLRRLVIAALFAAASAAAQLPPDLPPDPKGMADYLDNLLPPGGAPTVIDPTTGLPARDYSAMDEYDGIWSELSDEVKEDIQEIWEVREEEDLKRSIAEAEQRDRSLSVQFSQDLWVHATANFFISATGDSVSTVEDEIGEQLITSRSFYVDKLQTLTNDHQYLTTQLAAAGLELTETKASLERSDGYIWNDADFGQLNDSVKALEGRIDYLQLQLAAANGSYNRTIAEAANFERALVIRGLGESPIAHAAEEERRFQEVVRLTNELAANRIQLVAGLNVWNQRIEEEADPDVRQGFEDTRDLWLSVQQSELDARGKDLMQQYASNALATVGPDNHAAFLAEVVERGLDVHGTVEVQATETKEDTRRYMLDRVTIMAGGAIRTDVFDYDGYDFAADAADGIYEAYFTVDGAIAYHQRLGNYTVGGVSAVGDALVGTGDLLWELHDFGGELFLPTYLYGIDNPYGNENLTALFSVADASGGLADEVFSNTAIGLGFNVGAPETSAIYDVTQGLLGQAGRRLENANESELMNWLGYGVVTAATIPVSPEVELANAALWAGRVAPKAINALRLAQRGESTLEAAQALARLDGLAMIPPGSNRLPVPDDLPAGFIEAPTPVGNRSPVAGELGDAAPPPVAVRNLPDVGGAAAASRAPDFSSVRLPDEVAQVLPGPGGAAPVLATGSRVRIGNTEYTIGKFINAGGFSTVYHLEGPGGRALVLKVTRKLVTDGVDRTPTMFLNDAYGNAVLRSLGPDVVKVPDIHHQAELFNTFEQGSFLTVTDYIPEQNLIKQLGRAGLAAPTPQQIAAINRFKERLADFGYVWMDGKADNFAIGADGIPIVIDGGGMAKAASPAVARAILQDLEAPSPEALQRILSFADPETQALAWRSILDEKYASAMQFDEMRALGIGFEGLGNLPYSPLGALKYKALHAGTLGRGGTVPTPNLPRVNFPDIVPTPNAAAPMPIALSPAVNLQDCLVPPGSAFQTRMPFGVARGGAPRLRGVGADFGNARVFNDPLFVNPPVPAVLRPLTVSRPSHVTNPAPYCSGPGRLGARMGMGEVDGILHGYGRFDPTLRQRVGARLICFGSRLADGSCSADAQHVYAVNLQRFEDYAPSSSGQNEQRMPNPFRAEQAVNDPHFSRKGSWGQSVGDQWAIQQVGIDELLLEEIKDSKTRPIIAVIDTGLAWSHPDIEASSLWTNDDEIVGNGIDDDANGYVDDIIGWNFVEDNNLPWDLDGHGTLVAGIIAASNDNNEGIVGINPNARIMVLRALNEQGQTRATYLAEAIVYAANNGAQIINLSVGGVTKTQVEQMAIDYARQQGAIVVAAAGNEGSALDDYGPAGSEGVVTVAATGYDGARLEISNWGSAVDIAAPGRDVLGPRALGTDLMAKFDDIDYVPGDNIVGDTQQYYRATGTSFSAPIVAGAASLLLSRNPQLTAGDLERMIINSADDIDSPGIDQFTGYGVLNVKAALTAEPDFFITASISGVNVVLQDGAPVLQVLGASSANDLAETRLEFAPVGSDEWRLGFESTSVAGEVLGEIPAINFRGVKEWTLRLTTRHRNGQQREARFLLTLG